MKVGSKYILLSTIFMVPDGEEATFSHTLAEDDVLNCRIRFIHDEDEELKKKTAITVDFEDNVFIISFKNFSLSLGHSTTKPVRFGSSNKGEELSFLASVSKFKSFSKIEIQLMMGEIPS